MDICFPVICLKKRKRYSKFVSETSWRILIPVSVKSCLGRIGTLLVSCNFLPCRTCPQGVENLRLYLLSFYKNKEPISMIFTCIVVFDILSGTQHILRCLLIMAHADWTLTPCFCVEFPTHINSFSFTTIESSSCPGGGNWGHGSTKSLLDDHVTDKR